MGTFGALFFFLTLKTVFEGLVWHYWKQVDFKESLKFTAAQSALLVPYWFVMSLVVFTILGLFLEVTKILSIPMVNTVIAVIFLFGLTIGNNIIIGLLTKRFFFKDNNSFTNRTIVYINGAMGLLFILLSFVGRIIQGISITY